MAEEGEDPALIEHVARGIVSAFGHNPDTLVFTGQFWQAYVFTARHALRAFREYEERKTDGSRPQ